MWCGKQTCEQARGCCNGCAASPTGQAWALTALPACQRPATQKVRIVKRAQGGGGTQRRCGHIGDTAHARGSQLLSAPVRPARSPHFCQPAWIWVRSRNSCSWDSTRKHASRRAASAGSGSAAAAASSSASGSASGLLGPGLAGLVPTTLPPCTTASSDPCLRLLPAPREGRRCCFLSASAAAAAGMTAVAPAPPPLEVAASPAAATCSTQPSPCTACRGAACSPGRGCCCCRRARSAPSSSSLRSSKRSWCSCIRCCRTGRCDGGCTCGCSNAGPDATARPCSSCDPAGPAVGCAVVSMAVPCHCVNRGACPGERPGGSPPASAPAPPCCAVARSSRVRFARFAAGPPSRSLCPGGYCWDAAGGNGRRSTGLPPPGAPLPGPSAAGATGGACSRLGFTGEAFGRDK